MKTRAYQRRLAAAVTEYQWRRDLHTRAATVGQELDRLYHTAVRVGMPDEFLEAIVKNSRNAFGIATITGEPA
jgi:hypothetical protein